MKFSLCSAVLLSSLSLAGCVTYPPVDEAAPVEPVQRVIVYPANGQNEAQLDRDRYECHVWAVRESGFDPSRPGTPGDAQVRVEPASGANTVGGAIVGAILGSAIGGPRDSGAATVAGAVIGGAIGNSADQANAQASAQRRAALNEAQRGSTDSYRRAISACLTGRGYSVR